jgi:hypothetical protein
LLIYAPKTKEVLLSVYASPTSSTDHAETVIERNVSEYGKSNRR